MNLALRIAQKANVKQSARRQNLFIELCSVFPLKEIKTSQEHKTALRVMESVSDEIEQHVNSDLYNYGHALACLIEEYESKKFPQARITGIDLLNFLIEQNNLTQKDLTDEIGPQPIVSDILNHKRRLTRDHIERLAKRFNVSPAAFFDAS